MKILFLLLFLVSCNENTLNPKETDALRKDPGLFGTMAKQDPVPAPTVAPTNVARLESKIKDKEIYSKDYQMNCTTDLVPDPSSVAIYRCENMEAVCYSEYRGGMTCKFK